MRILSHFIFSFVCLFFSLCVSAQNVFGDGDQESPSTVDSGGDFSDDDMDSPGTGKESIITFADANVKALCVSAWDTDGDGELSTTEATLVTDLGIVFRNNTSITTFDELKYFTSLFQICSNAFEGCSSLEHLALPKNITMIGEGAFKDCTALTFITIPAGVTAINNEAFISCSNLKEVNVQATVPPTTTGDVFNKFDILLNVPQGSIDTYQPIAPWSKFTKIADIDFMCASPTFSIENGKLVFSCETTCVDYHYQVLLKSTTSKYASLFTTYSVTAYSTKAGYGDSEKVTKDVVLSKGIKGDVNEDGKVSITDAVSVVNIILNNDVGADSSIR